MRKKLFAVIMSVMMMVTFMPAMAFATPTPGCTATLQEVVWSDDYTSATATYLLQETGKKSFEKTITLDAERMFAQTGNEKSTETNSLFYTTSAGTENKGMVVARVEKKAEIEHQGKTYGVSGVTSGQYFQEAYYDLTGASFVTTNPKTGVHEMNAKTYYEMINQDKEYTTPEFADKNNDGKADYDVTNLFGEVKSGVQVVGVNFVQPADLAGTAKQKEVAVDLSAGALAKIGKLEYVLPRYELYDEAAALDLTIKFVNPLKNVINADKFKQDYKLSLYVSDVSMVEVKMDGIKEAEKVYSLNTQSGKNGETIETVYRGANQNFQVVSKGVNVTYSTDYKRTWTETAPEMVDVDKYNFLMKVTRKDCEDQIFSITVDVKPAKIKLDPKAPQMGFPVGYKLNVSDVVDVMVQKYYPQQQLQNTADDNFEVLNNAAITAGLEKYVSLGSYQSQGGFSGDQSITVKFDNDAFNEDAKKDEALAKIAENYYMPGNTNVNVNFGVAYNDVTAPSQVKTYHVKNAKALKKNQKKFQLKAVADFGTPTFIKLSGNSKIKVYNNGKVLVKKGLKKGKYVVKVKVKAPGATATKKLTVKVVK